MIADAKARAEDIKDADLDQVDGGFEINFAPTAPTRMSNTWMPVQDAVNINNEYHTIDTVSVNINNEY